MSCARCEQYKQEPQIILFSVYSSHKFTETYGGNDRWNEHTRWVLKEQHGMDRFMEGLNFPNTSEAQGQQGRSPVSILITWEIRLRACWGLNIIIRSDLVEHSITQRTTAGGGSVLQHSWGPRNAADVQYTRSPQLFPELTSAAQGLPNHIMMDCASKHINVYAY